MSREQGYVRQSEVSHEDFVAAWEGSQTVAEACERTGLTKCQVMGRVYRLQQAGIPLRPMSRRRPGETIDLRSSSGSVPAFRRRWVGPDEWSREGVDPEDVAELREAWERWRMRG